MCLQSPLLMELIQYIIFRLG